MSTLKLLSILKVQHFERVLTSLNYTKGEPIEMSTVPVTYKLKTLKVKITPSTPSNEILERAATHFKLDPATTGLFHNNIELSHGLPFRLLNLPAGAKLALKPTELKGQSEITVKVQFMNSNFTPSSIVKKFNSQQTVRSAIQDVENELGIEVFGKGHILKFQSITKAAGENEIHDLSLARFGVENNGIIRVSISTPNTMQAEPSSSSKVVEENVEVQESNAKEQNEASSVPVVSNTLPLTEHETKTPIARGDVDNDIEVKDADEKPEPIPSPDAKPLQLEPEPTSHPKSQQAPSAIKEIPQHVYVYKPSNEPIIRPSTNEEVYEVTVSHARTYQNMLSKAAHETAKSKRLRQEEQKKKITNVEFRIKFPDNAALQVNFKPTDTNSQVYDFVKGTLVNPYEEFTLSIPYPPLEIKNDASQLLTNFGSRNLLMFNTSRKTGVFLKEEYTAKAKSLKDAEEVKLDLARHLVKDDYDDDDDETNGGKIHNGVISKSKDKLKAPAEEGKGGKKVPKWLKLGKR